MNPSGWIALTRILPRYRIHLSDYLVGTISADPVAQFLEQEYRANRCAVFHAKSTERPVLLPGAATDRRQVSAAVEPPIRLVVDLIRAIHNIIFPSGGMVVGGFMGVIENLRSVVTRSPVSMILTPRRLGAKRI